MCWHNANNLTKDINLKNLYVICFNIDILQYFDKIRGEWWPDTVEKAALKGRRFIKEFQIWKKTFITDV